MNTKFSTEKHKLTDELKLLDDKVHATDDPIPENTPLVYIISGGRGRGKSTLLLNLLRTVFKKKFSNIFLVSPTARKDEKFDKIVTELEVDDKYYDVCSEENLAEIWDRLKELHDEHPKHKNMLILDDCLYSFKTSSSNSILDQMVVNSRHLNLTIIILTQKYNKINPTIREQVDLISFYQTNNKREVETLINDISIDPKQFENIYKYATNNDDRNAFLHMNLMKNIKFYKKFDRIITNE
jgi:hypothetical protein